MYRFFSFLLVLLAVGAAAQPSFAWQGTVTASATDLAGVEPLPDAPMAAQSSSTKGTEATGQSDKYEGKQTRRILGIIPNFRSVSVDEKLSPLTPGTKFKLMVEDSFDYSAFIYVGGLAGTAMLGNSYPEFHHGAPAFARYYWHSFADTLDGNNMTEFLFPVMTKEDPRYYTLGRGGFFKRTKYAVTRLAIARTDKGNWGPNLSEIVGNGSAAGISNLYYPSQERTWTKTGQRWVAQVGLDGLSNLLKEFWPDLNSKFFHNKY